MGNYLTKFLPHNHEAHNKKGETESSEVKTSVNKAFDHDDKNMCTPVALQKKIFVDPRSASSDIHRTPIEVCCTPGTCFKTTAGIRVERKPYLETDLDRVMPPLTPKKSEPRLSELNVEGELGILKDYQTPTIKSNTSFQHKLTAIEKDRFRLLGIDPRSPAADFSRTPILTPASMIRLRARSQENLNRRGSYETDVCRYSYSEMSYEFGVPEVQALPDLAVTAIKALNLVDIQCEDKFSASESSCSDDSPNTVILKNSRDENDKSLDKIKFGNANVQKYMCVTDVSPSTEDSNTRHKRSLEQVKLSLKLDDYEAETPETELKNKKPILEEVSSRTKNSSDTEKIIVWRDSMSTLPQPEQVGILKSNDQKVSAITMACPTKEEVIITFDDEMVVKDSLSLKISKVPSENRRKPEIIRRNKNTKEDKILAEEKKVFSDNKTSDDTAKTRTPLGNRSNNGKVSLLTAKSPQLLRNKGITPKMLQENTPPHRRSMVKSKLSGIQWDPDSTVLI